MRVFGIFLMACLGLTLLRAALQVGLVALLIFLLWAGIFHPKETAGFIVLCTLVRMANQHPLAGLIVLALMIVYALAAAKVH